MVDWGGTVWKIWGINVGVGVNVSVGVKLSLGIEDVGVPVGEGNVADTVTVIVPVGICVGVEFGIGEIVRVGAGEGPPQAERPMPAVRHNTPTINRVSPLPRFFRLA